MEIPKAVQGITNTVKKSELEEKKLPKIALPLATLAVATLGCSLETGSIVGTLVLMVGFPAMLYIGSRVFLGNSGKKK